MRKQLLSVFLPLLILVVLAAAETPSTGTEATKHAALQRVNVVRGEDGISLEITARGPVTPKLTTLTSPARVVIDLPNTVTATSQNHITVGSDGVKDVRIGMDNQKSPTTRVVVDLDQACQHELVPGGEGKMILKLHAPATSAKAAVHAAAPAVPQTVAVVTPQTVVSKPVVSAPKPEAAVASAQPPVAAPAQEFVFVEPTFKPKAETAEVKADTSGAPARVVEAAAKFVQKPDGNILPLPSASMQTQPPSPVAPSAPQPAVNMAAEQKAQMQQGGATVGVKYTGEPISVNLKDVDLKDFFRLIHEISGLNVVLDPDVKGSLTMVLDDVAWDQALDIVLKNNDLARQLEGNVLRIATVDTMRKEAESRRAEKEAEALAVDKVTVTRFLGYAHSKDVMPLVKKFLSQRGDVISDDRTNALIISDIPAVMPQLDRLLTQLDRKTQEVEIEARVVFATRTFSRDLGSRLGFSWNNSTTTVGGDSNVGQTTVTDSTGKTTITKIPLFSNYGLTAPTTGLSLINLAGPVQIDANLEAAEKRGLAKILSRPRVVTQNNIQAIVKQGTRIPVVTTSQLNGPATVTYIDAVLRLTVIPQITAENTIFLNVDVENTTADFATEVFGNPTLQTQQATTQVLVADGGTVVIGGVMKTNNTVTVNQTPVLGNIPYIGNLFKLKSVSTSTGELLFFITPRIVQD
jgi:type IV pilus assembly protein PilQ